MHSREKTIRAMRTANSALILAAASTLAACGGGAANSGNGEIPTTPRIESVASASAPVSSATPIQILAYNGYFYPWLNFSAGASVVPYIASTSAAQAIILSAGLPSRAAYTIELMYGRPTFVENTLNGSVTLKASNTSLVPGKTYFILGTYDGSTARLYVNGTLSASAPITGGVWNDRSTGEAIGADVNRNNPFNGLISNVTIVPSTITPTPNPSAAPTIAPTPAPKPSTAPTLIPTAAPTNAPAPPPNAPIVTPASVSLLSLGSTATVQFSEANYSGGFSLSSTCANIATLVQNGASVTLTATGAGNCSVTATDAKNQRVILRVSVTSTSFQFQ